MGISSRIYLFPDDGSLRRIPKRISNELPHGNDAIPEYASTRQRVAQIIVESEDGKPVRILDARGFHWTFDADGRIDEDLQRSFHEHMDVFGAAERARRTRVVDLVPEIKKRELKARHEWTLSAEDLDRIAADIWPGVNGPAPEVDVVKGAKPKKPALTNEARWALQRLNDSVNAIKRELDGLSERGLKGLAFEAVRMSTVDDEAIWRGIADESKRKEAIRAAHRTGRGEWYAVLEVSRAHRTLPYLWEEVAIAHAKCSSRKEAVEAGRRLMAEKADWLDVDIQLEVSLRSALEWRPEEWE